MPRRRLITRLALCLALGLMTTVAAAWGFALRGADPNARTRIILYGPFTGLGGQERWLYTEEQSRTGGRLRFMPGAEPTWSRRRPVADPPLPIEAYGRGWGRDYDALVADEGGSDAVVIFEQAYGWPRPALWFGGDLSRSAGSRVGGIALPPAWGGLAANGDPVFAKALPVRPIWGGLAIGTAVYAAAWAVPLLGLPVLRAMRIAGLRRAARWD